MVDDGWPVALATSRALIGYRANLRFFDRLMGMVRARAASTHGSVVVAAAGNDSRSNESPYYKIGVSLPAAAESIISVGALRRDGERMSVAHFSNTLPEVSAPGVDIVSAKIGGGFAMMDGTSMACPHVAGVAALWWNALYSSGAVFPRADLVAAKLLANAKTSIFSSGVEIADRGAGIVTAPQE